MPPRPGIALMRDDDRRGAATPLLEACPEGIDLPVWRDAIELRKGLAGHRDDGVLRKAVLLGDEPGLLSRTCCHRL